MDHYEVTTEYLAEDGLIDLEKNKELLHEKFMVNRCFSEKWERTKEGVPQFMAIAEKYGVEYFAGMSPSGGSSEARLAWINGLRELGQKRGRIRTDAPPFFLVHFVLPRRLFVPDFEKA